MKTEIRTEVAQLWQIAWPVLIGQLATVGMSVADVAMTGHLSAQDLAAVALSFTLVHYFGDGHGRHDFCECRGRS